VGVSMLVARRRLWRQRGNLNMKDHKAGICQYSGMKQAPSASDSVALINDTLKCQSCIHGLQSPTSFPIPEFGIEDFVIPGSRRDYRISRKCGIYH